MRFCQIDQIAHLDPGNKIEAYRSLDGTEDYLRDHFPRFAVMPGVLMLESLFQASGLLVRATENHEAGLVILRTAKNVKFADFVQPGQTLRIEAQIMKSEGRRYTVKAVGYKDDAQAVSGRLIIDCVDTDDDEIVDKHAALYMKQLTEQLQ
ncbi:MAG: 3-hydroxyacyl-ACP dehydratase FabZ family protein [Pirellulaceae bacterium]